MASVWQLSIMIVVLAACGADDPARDTISGDAADTISVDVADTVSVDVADARVDSADVEDTDVADDTIDEDGTSVDVADVADDSAEIGGDVADIAGDTVPLPGFGAISGACGVLDDELTSTSPDFFVNHLDFADDGWEVATELDQLTAGGQEMWADGNAGGSSVESEIFAFEVLDRCELATLIKTENEVVYDPVGSKKTDILVSIDGLKIGVSVTRAVSFPHETPYSVEDAKSLLEKKLGDILVSSANVVENDKWVKQILHVLAYDAPHAVSLESAWNSIDAALKADTIIIVTVTDGDDAIIY